MKALIPSHKENKRYLLIHGKNLKLSIEKAILDYTGVLGMSKTGLNWIKVGKDSAIIAINREAVNNVRASFVVWPEKIEVKKISGTLKGLSKK